MWRLPLANMLEWGEDEWILLILSLVATIHAIYWVGSCFSAVPELGARPPVRRPLVAAILASLACLVFVSWRWTAIEIRDGQDYILLALLMGGAWFSVYVHGFQWLGIGLFEDACERTNSAAAVALSGGIVGGNLLYCGSICGEGPSFWNNVFTITLAGAAWFFVWVCLEFAGDFSRRIAEERGAASGRRLAGFLVATGVILGRAAAGNWESMDATVGSLVADGWPALALVPLAAGWERFTARVREPAESPLAGWPVASAYVFASLGWVWHLGWWEGVP